ncbi:MAG: bifunctional UDP-N-acetylglucosamine diphosphorylase/glucosamine-1-phosphate N-acetyltransferase GlmU [Desulfovibrio sp.]|jgi:bifunctional UDP-N-acetylglucosamine pyrophosphorylase/glucosamine-1-phosphate N-acetyltransferase|nr:bifunctional UDP-N-acetylglucosamine diphosphorylase/glucosamine-1-phosphate N-acetyltransferase GlmU [Desulfovibrio sp.]
MKRGNRLSAVVFAAGKGTRMHSPLPKVLQPLLGEPMLRYALSALDPLCPGRVHTLVGYRADLVRGAFPEREGLFIVQEDQLGTGHALTTAWEALRGNPPEYLLVVNGDTPLPDGSIPAGFVEESMRERRDLSFISLTLPDTGAFGLVLRRDGRVTGIVEAGDFSEAVHGPKSGEINTGIYCIRTETIAPLLPLLGRDNARGEVYITDLVALAAARGLSVEGRNFGNDPRLAGVNTPAELSKAEEYLRASIVERHMERGVLIRAPHSVRIGPAVRIEPGADLTGPCEIYGRSSIGAGARIASHCRLQDVVLEQDAELRSFCHVEHAAVGRGCAVGPYARLRPGSVLEEGAHVGNFVELKKARLGKGAKAGHLSYLGDAEVGDRANIGAGAITCNYDGVNKHRTRIGAGAFIGSNAALVAPVDIGDGALIGAGSVITKNVPADNLGVGRAPQRSLPLRAPGAKKS